MTNEMRTQLRNARAFKRRNILGMMGGAAAVALVGCGDDAKPATTATGATAGQPAGATAPGQGQAAAAATPSSSAVAASTTATSVSQLQCVIASPQETEGPYFVEELLERSDVRSDPTDKSVAAGIPLVLKVNVSKVDGGACAPLVGAHFDIWHCDAKGVYSDVAANNSIGKKHLRGYQVTDAAGAVSFTTIYPGWYQGRTVHIHIKIRTYSPDNRKTYEFTSQIYFDDAVTDAAFKVAPYNTRGARDTRNNNDSVYTGGSTDGSVKSNSGAQMLAVPVKTADGYSVSMNVGVDTTRTSVDNLAGGGGRGAPPAR